MTFRSLALCALLVSACQATDVERTVVMQPSLQSAASADDKITLTTKSPNRKNSILEDQEAQAECWTQLSELEQLLEDEPARASEISAITKIGLADKRSNRCNKLEGYHERAMSLADKAFAIGKAQRS